MESCVGEGSRLEAPPSLAVTCLHYQVFLATIGYRNKGSSKESPCSLTWSAVSRAKMGNARLG